MKQNLNFILVFILLATLSMVNAIPHRLQKRSFSFGSCTPLKGKNPPPIISVEVASNTIVPGQTNTLVVTGMLIEPIFESTQLIAQFVDSETNNFIGEPSINSICGGAGCPIKGGTQFTTIIGNLLAPSQLPDEYSIVVSVIDEFKDILGCANALIDNE
ncbi:16263_t:CDS:1 [Funneliformis mosseae]|uniref:Phosphatidylglycerol/phosphatidylinositol transfer protein n=1 Tax=Funneliformis mosseae TaxID=27381 RepID=A0A9N9ECE4_FUNMO|nr:16263_t:CDS:1 [Funneliformis mosseae]